MQRPIGVTLLAIGAGLAGLVQIWRILIFAGIINWTFVGKEVAFSSPQWGQIFWSAILALIWFWEAAGFWNLRGYAWGFGNFIALFTFIWGFFALLFGSSVEAETIPWFLALVIYMYLNYPGVKDHFVKAEMDRLTPEQRVAMEQLAAANAGGDSGDGRPGWHGHSDRRGSGRSAAGPGRSPAPARGAAAGRSPVGSGLDAG